MQTIKLGSKSLFLNKLNLLFFLVFSSFSQAHPPHNLKTVEPETEKANLNMLVSHNGFAYAFDSKRRIEFDKWKGMLYSLSLVLDTSQLATKQNLPISSQNEMYCFDSIHFNLHYQAIENDSIFIFHREASFSPPSKAPFPHPSLKPKEPKEDPNPIPPPFPFYLFHESMEPISDSDLVTKELVSSHVLNPCQFSTGRRKW